MTDSNKQFACTVQEYDNWDEKKQAMMLNLGLVNKQNEGADQTPTPTRFIRNCEEVGLFQDLQNVNPFDEVFKKAVDGNNKSVTTLNVSRSDSDDTLHTPHILPHIENQKVNNLNADNLLHNIITDDGNIDGSTEKSKDCIVISKESNQLSEVTKKAIKVAKNVGESADVTLKNLRESNRAAQKRCRKRKIETYKKMVEELRLLKEENARLLQENTWLKGQLIKSEPDAEKGTLSGQVLKMKLTSLRSILPKKT